MEEMKYEQKITDRTFEFAVEIVRLCQELDKKKGVSKILMSQLVRSGTSILHYSPKLLIIMSNIDYYFIIRHFRVNFIPLK